MNLSRSIQILLSSSVQDEEGVAIALYEVRERENGLHLCGVVGERSLATWKQQLTMNLKEHAWAASGLNAVLVKTHESAHEKLHFFPVEAEGTIGGILCAKPPGNCGLSQRFLAKLNEASKSLAAVLALAKKIRSFDHFVSEISALHLELADQKIFDRARGLLEDPGSADAIAAHVNRVSESIRFIDEMKATIEDIRAQLSVRQLLHQAKEKLQKDKGITEEEAYLRLRHMSRRSRTPLGIIAKLVLGKENAIQLASQ
jgi:AmiR/NasT family two-component response regulator